MLLESPMCNEQTKILTESPALINIQIESKLLPSFPTRETLYTHSPPENKLNQAVVWQVFVTILCFHLLLRQACGGLTQSSCLLAPD